MAHPPHGERILSIQSHVAFGYVGNKAAVFPLQCLGFDVDVVNTVNYSNHVGYGAFGGSKTQPEELATVFRQMRECGLLSPARLITGYTPGANALNEVVKLAKNLRSEIPSLIYLLDPVLGDAGRLYVSPDVVPIYQSLLPIATIITPNWFEVETLTKVPIKDQESLQRALKILHIEYRVPHVVISSIPLTAPLRERLPNKIQSSLEIGVQVSDDPQPQGDSDTGHSAPYLLCLSSSWDVSKSNQEQGDEDGLSHDTPPAPVNGASGGPEANKFVHGCCIPCIPHYFSGVGDLFSALVLAHYHPRTLRGLPRTIGGSNANATSSGGTSYAPHSQTQVTPQTQYGSGDDTTPLSCAVGCALTKTYAIIRLTQECAQEELRSSAELSSSVDQAAETESQKLIRTMKARELRIVQGQGIIRGDTEVDQKVMDYWEEFWG